MAKQFEFRFIDGSAPSGSLEADDLLALVQSLKEVATKLGRDETEGEGVGRPTKRAQSLAKLNVSLAPGSTRVLLQRTALGEGALDFDLEEEQSFDKRFEEIVSSIGSDARPNWVAAPLAAAAGKLRAALARIAPQVEFRVDGHMRQQFATSETHYETWVVQETESGTPTISFIGRLRVVNLDTHRLQVTDDAGNRVRLPGVTDDAGIGRLLDAYVEVVGLPVRDDRGRLTHIHEAVVQPAPLLPGGIAVGPRISAELDEIAPHAPGPSPDGIPGFTDDEADSFFEAIGV